jgi:beta-N-acetylhexosaminidase
VMGFEGTTVTPQVQTLIEKYHVAAICLQAKNLKSKLGSSCLLRDRITLNYPYQVLARL